MDYHNHKVKQAGEIVQSFMAISRILTGFSAQNAASLGLTLPQMAILNTINALPGLTLKEITDKLNIPKSTVSINADNLFNLGLIEREIRQENRREVHFTATLKGQERAQKSAQNAFSYQAMLLALEKMPAEDIQALMRMHQELLEHLQNRRF